MKILITGGAGFIGSHVVDACIADGHDVVVLDDLSTGVRENVNPKARFYEVDICSPEAAAILAQERPDVLNHHAAQIDVRASVEEPMRDLRTDVLGFVNLLEAGRRAGLKKVIFASSGGAVYGEQGTFPATEDHPTRPLSPYGIHKLMCEQYLSFYQGQYGIPSIALRYSNVYGPRQNARGEAGVVAVFLSKMLSGEAPTINGDGVQTRDYVYVSDVVAANRLALSFPSPLRGEGQLARRRSSGGGEGACCYNVSTSLETDVNTIFRALRECAGATCQGRHGPAKAGEQRRSSLSFAKAERELGWRPTVTLTDGMSQTTQWFREQSLRGTPRLSLRGTK